MEKVLVKNLNGCTLDFYAAAHHMEYEIVEPLGDIMAPCTEQEFFTAYEYAYKFRYRKEWELSKVNPVVKYKSGEYEQ